jgi:hypothetical protein
MVTIRTRPRNPPGRVSLRCRSARRFADAVGRGGVRAGRPVGVRWGADPAGAGAGDCGRRHGRRPRSQASAWWVVTHVDAWGLAGLSAASGSAGGTCPGTSAEQQLRSPARNSRPRPAAIDGATSRTSGDLLSSRLALG